ncbi:hypothetical protein GOP47_0029590 [Adiantum capillus-veneris]|nr:hypothetical protein GOP47_0029590 [Adiantum capillus-veneris]
MARDSYHKMQAGYLNSSTHGFIGLFKACAALHDIERGCALHADIARLGLLEVDVFLGTAVIDMYAKCGSVAKAQEVFDSLLNRDVVSWTSLISGYAEHGPYEEAFGCVRRMRQEGGSPNSHTLVCLLKACGHLGAIERAEEVHTEIVLKGLEGEELIGNSLADTYAKCGQLSAAYAFFCSLSVVSWTALILGHVNCGRSKEALDCYEQMQHSGSSSNAITCICTLKACATIQDIKRGQQMHTDVVLKGFDDDIRIGNTLLDLYFKCGLLADAEMSFAKLPWQDVVSWNILLAGYSEHCCGENALVAFEEMQSKGVSADGATFMCLLRACSKLGNTHKGMELHMAITKTGFVDQKLPIANTLVDMYGKSSLLAEAQHVFDKLQVRSLVSWNALITGYAEHAHAEEALQCFNQMHFDSFCPDAITCVCGLKACGGIEAIVKGQEIHLVIVKLGIEEECHISNSLVHMYAKCGLPAEAQEIFEKVPVRDVVCWTSLMVGWAQFGKTENVLAMFEGMIREGVTPSSITLTCVLNACSDEGVMFYDYSYFSPKSNDSSFLPTLEHFTCMIDLLGRAGRIDAAMRLTKEMPVHPDIVIWLSLLGACRNWGNVELGKQAFENALQLDKKSEAAFLCMFNFFVEAGMHDEAYAVEVKRAGMEA